MPKMKATRRLPYAGRIREIGEEFEASDKDAKVLRHIGADLVESGYQTRVLTAAQTGKPGTTPRGLRAVRQSSLVSKTA